MKKVVSVIKRLGFSIKEVYKSSPLLFCASIVVTILEGLITYSIMYISRDVLNQLQYIYIYDYPIITIIPLIIASTVIVLASTFLNWIYTVITEKQKSNFQIYINKIFLKKNSKLDIAAFDTPNYYSIINEVEKSKKALNLVVYRVVHFFSFSISLTISSSIILSYKNEYLGLIIIAFIVPALFNKGKYYLNLYKYDADNQPLTRRINYCAHVLLGRDAAKEIRFYNIKKYLLEKYNEYINQYIKNKKRLIYKYGFIDSVCNVLPTIGVTIAMILVTSNIVNESGNIGDFSFYLSVLLTFKSNLIGLVEDISKIQESDYAISKYLEFINLQPAIKDNEGETINSIKKIEFKHVTFKYPDANEAILDGIDFTIKVPEKVAIVGLNGAGKTTIVKLLLRYYDVTSGEILINDENIKNFNLNELRKLIAPAFQDSVLYSLTLRENVSLSDINQSSDEEKILSKLSMVHLDEIAKKEYLDTDLTRNFDESGIILSGGQKQKLILARLAFMDADLFIMDEPTAALDPISENKVLTSFRQIYGSKGMIIISHRLSNIIDMDKILVIDKGKIVESGSHYDLFQKNGLYHEMFIKQSSNYS